MNDLPPDHPYVSNDEPDLMEEEAPKQFCERCDVELPSTWESDYCGNCQAALAYEREDHLSPPEPRFTYGAKLSATKLAFGMWAISWGELAQMRTAEYDGPIIIVDSFERMISMIAMYRRVSARRRGFHIRWVQRGEQFMVYPTE